MSGSPEKVVDVSSGKNITELPQDKTLTPEGVKHDFSTHVPLAWNESRSAAFPWPMGDDRPDSFNIEGLIVIVRP